MTPLYTTKSEYRAHARSLRASLPIDAISQHIVDHLLRWPVFQSSDHVLLFYPMAQQHEIDLLALLTQAPDKQYYLPRMITPSENNSSDNEMIMAFFCYQLGDATDTHAYGVVEPKATAPAFQAITQPDRALLIAPALLADHAGFRVGYGKSFYDRWLNTYAERSKTTPCPMLSTTVVVPNVLYVPSLPRDDWDTPLEAIITETGLFTAHDGHVKRV